ncbi:cytochrome c [Salipiger sp. H15]|uniref:Cytochrome c n=1 Tax=Alloyangia sp. H15 TaxID=3029062 RepID=A0AAU8AFA5_9RHOB
MKITAGRLTVAATATLAVIGTAALAQQVPAPLKARQGEMNILAINLGILGDMARGKSPYDAEAAQMAAESIVAVTMINKAPLFPAGTSEMELEGTRAKAEIWDDWEGFSAKWTGLAEAATGLQKVAATGQEALGPAVGQLGGACKACHDTFRAPE